MSQTIHPPAALAGRGRTWFHALADDVPTAQGFPASVLVADTTLEQERVRYLAVVPDPQNRFPRARGGELGIDEGWGLAAAVREAIKADQAGERRALVALVDVPSQAYGRREEVLGIHLALAAAVDAYATARRAGHPLIALIVGQAISGGLLAHGAQANRILALDDPGVIVQAMARAEAAHVTRRSVDELNALAETVLPMSFEVHACVKLGIVQKLLPGVHADAPTDPEIAAIKQELITAITEVRHAGSRDLADWRASPDVSAHRAASLRVRERMVAEW